MTIVAPAADQYIRESWIDAITDAVNGYGDLQPYYIPTWRYRTTAQTVTNSTTLVDDDALFVTGLPAGSIWDVQCLIRYLGYTSNDFKIGWSAPAGSTFLWEMRGAESGATSGTAQGYWGVNTLAGTDTAGAVTASELHCAPSGLLTVGGTAGTFQFRFAQGTAGAATDAKCQPGSRMRLLRVA